MEETVVESVTQVADQTRTMLHLDELMAYLTWGNLMKVAIAVISVLVFYVCLLYTLTLPTICSV